MEWVFFFGGEFYGRGAFNWSGELGVLMWSGRVVVEHRIKLGRRPLWQSDDIFGRVEGRGVWLEVTR